MQHDNRVIVVGAGPVGAVMTLALVQQGHSGHAAWRRCRTRPRTSAPPPCILRPSRCWSGSGLEKDAFSEEPSGGMSAPLFHFRDRVTGELFAVFDISLLDGEIALSVRAAMGAVQARACGAAAYPGERSRRGAFLRQGDRARAARRPCRRDREQRDRRDRDPSRPLCHRHRRRQQHGAQGSRSIAFEGFTYAERFIKIGTTFDFGGTGKSFCTRNYFSDPDEWLNLFKVKGYGPPGIWRGVFPVPAGESDEAAMSPEGSSAACRASIPKAATTTFPIMRSTPCISAWPRPSTRAACCWRATAPTSTIRSAAWA